MSATAHDSPTAYVHPHADRITQLRKVAEWLATHPDVKVTDFTVDPTDGPDRVCLNYYGVDTPEQITEITRSLGGRWIKDPRDTLFYLEQEIAPGAVYRLIAWRDQVCTRVVTGTETHTVIEPDPDMVAALPTVERVETVETVEWRCEPILAQAT